ncbi:hypothetical protein BGZ59_000306 [Podila verticillata]|nr:hypothetical protein BGZ59_000306 [Podila verticillata]KFH65366.1 hypothetical protein MVEG_08844 [Podila verticillata NRRL 6337]
MATMSRIISLRPYLESFHSDALIVVDGSEDEENCLLPWATKNLLDVYLNLNIRMHPWYNYPDNPDNLQHEEEARLSMNSAEKMTLTFMKNLGNQTELKTLYLDFNSHAKNY